MPQPSDSCSVVIPVRNDAKALQRCLIALSRQTLHPARIIVVDNGSTDDSIKVARAHGATVVRESQIGIPAAAARGYDAADTDLILRLDADSVPHSDWIQRVMRRFQRDSALDALTGPGDFTAIPARFRHLLTGWYWRFYFDGLEQRIGVTPLFGSNLAMRAAAWQRVSASVHRGDTNVHDDLDLTIHLMQARQRLACDPALLMPVSARPLLHPVGMLRRAQRATHTLALHADPPRSTARWILDSARRRELLSS